MAQTQLSIPFRQNTHGNIPYTMTNDYMFRAVLQSNNKVLRGLICSLLHLTESEIHSVVITNPIVLGEAIESKELRLDVNVWLNNNTRINLEMQVANKLNWKDRSLLYLCRSFDNLRHGQDYLEIQPTIHIGFLNYTLFKDNPEFYATYKLENVKTHHIYSDKFTLCVVDLTCIDLATDEDRKYHIDSWAALFKATTWEEINMIASKNEYLNEASNSIFQFNTDEQIRKLCRDREEYYQDLRNYDRVIAHNESVISKQNFTIEEQNSTIEEQNSTIEEQNSTIKEQSSTINEQAALIQKLTDEINALKKQTKHQF